MNPTRILCSALLVAILALVPGCGGKKYHESLQMPNFNYGEILDGHMKRATLALQKVQDMQTAKQAAADLTAINIDLDDLVYNMPRLSDEGQFQLGKLAGQHLSVVEPISKDIARMPPLDEVLGAPLGEMMGYLKQMMTGNVDEG